jgi:hypothetical protein
MLYAVALLLIWNRCIRIPQRVSPQRVDPISLVFLPKIDCKVILHLYKEVGTKKTLNEISGYFAFALWDDSNKKLLIARFRIRGVCHSTIHPSIPSNAAANCRSAGDDLLHACQVNNGGKQNRAAHRKEGFDGHLLHDHRRQKKTVKREEKK